MASPPKVNFAVFSDGAIKSGLTTANTRFAIAKLVPGTNGDPDQWVSYIYRTETAAAGAGPGGTPVLASAKQATTDTAAASQLVYNEDGYYTYTFSTDIKDPTKTNGVVFEPNRTHRIAIQLSYKNAAGETVLVNPYFDFTFDADGKSVAVTDATKTRKMTDVSSCNGCHEKLALHGGGRVDTQYCVMCHNPGTIDANSGNVLTLSTMAHKIHAGRLLKSKLAAGGEDYAIWGFGNSKHDYAEVGFPQDLRNCTVCHSASNPKTPQGDNWKTKVSKEACLTCHANNTGSDWDTKHVNYAVLLNGAGATAKGMTNQQCVDCHKSGTNIAPDRVHWNQNEENAAKYKMNIDSATYDAANRKVVVTYSLVDPTNGNAAYNLVTADCASTTVPTCGTSTKFGNLRFYLAYQNMVGQLSGVTEFSAYNNGGSGANAYAYKGTNLGGNKYSVDIPLPADTATAVASGTARVVSIGQIKEPQLQAKWATDPRPEVVPQVLINTVVKHSYKDVALTGTLQARRDVVSNDKCNVCHGALGTTSGSNTLAAAFHSGARNTVESCVICHDANRMSSTIMTNGLTNGGVAVNESYQFKRMIHGIHGNSKRTTPYTHGNPMLGSFDKSGKLLTTGTFVADQKVTINTVSTTVIPAGTVIALGETFETVNQMIDAAARGKGYTGATVAPIENYAAEVAYPQVGLNCNACHVNNSYKSDKSTLGAVVFKNSGVTDPNLWKVISPKAASCTACHDSSAAIGHVTTFGGSSFSNLAQNARPQETCDDCHAPGGFKGVDSVHGQK
ncbi:MAG: OmcA/MtrC family decaheme c-type cytochrome [Aquabacterium sp.]|nr:OmcA/MtrC family decaheme c-type cytochrome [Aquabacterium sp.]